MKKALLSVLVVFGAYFLYEAFTPGQHDALASCLTEKGAVMYGTDWCPHCQNQKRAFGKSFRLIDYVNCDIERAACEAAGVRGYPTWVIGEKRFEGEQPLQVLASAAGCRP